MAMKVATFNGCKVYNLASGKTMPQWLSDAKRRAMAKDEDYRRRLELIQDFEMTVASQCIKMTKDGEHIIVTGTYPPVVRCYTVSDLALKFQRGLTSDVVAFETLSDDFGKLVFLQSDRTLNFHAPYGTHYSVRVPKFGRDLAYNWDSCDLFVAGSGDEVYRLNLESGQFREPFKLSYNGCNKLSINQPHQLLACGGESAVCEFWDCRSRKAVSQLSVDVDKSVSISSLKFDTDGLTLGVGTSNGNCILYDIRSSVPLYTKEHQYGLPVVDIVFHNSSRHVISTDKKVVKIWERDGASVGKIMTNIETPADINNVLVVEDKRGSSGLIMLAGEQSRVMTYFVPQLGPAPRWCSFLEGLTEELEESVSQSVYEDYKFLTKPEVEEIGAGALIGTPMLKGYMHGFFIEMKLYNKLRAVSKPFEYEEYRLKRIREKIDERRQSRIVAQKRQPKVNKNLAEKLSKQPGSSKGSGIDDRFADLFNREEFQVDEESLEFKLKNPSKGHNQRSQDSDSENDLRDLFTKVDAAEANGDDDSDYGLSDQDEDVDIGYREPWNQNGDRDVSDDSDTEPAFSRGRGKRRGRGEAQGIEEDGQIVKASKVMKGLSNASKRTPQLYEIADGVDATSVAFRHSEDVKRKRALSKSVAQVPLMSRVKAANGKDQATSSKIRYVRSGSDGLVRELSFVPKSDERGKQRELATPADSDSRSKVKDPRTQKPRDWRKK